MTDIQLNLTSLSHLVAMWLVIVLLSFSLFTWARLLHAASSGQPWAERSAEPRATWTSFAEFTAIGLVVLMLLLHLALEFKVLPTKEPKPDEPKETLTAVHVLNNLALTGSLALILGATLVYSQQPAEGFGLKRENLSLQIRDGAQGFLLALIPTGVFLLVTASFRNRDTQNPLLTLLADSPDPGTILIIFLAAVVIAPLYEEMVFRVVLQAWLTSRLGASVAIPLTAVAFAAVHGMTDAVALIPLALILGYVFDRRHSYVSVLVIHALFNATMLTLALLTQVGQPGPVDPAPKRNAPAPTTPVPNAPGLVPGV